jgi:hypothetical protein
MAVTAQPSVVDPQPRHRAREVGLVGTFALAPDGSGVLRGRAGLSARVPADLVRRFQLVDGARLHARLRCAEPPGAGGSELVRILAWHDLTARVLLVTPSYALLRAEDGPPLYLPSGQGAALGLREGGTVHVVAAPTFGLVPRWRVESFVVG